jgi:hypothetical protein
MQSGYKCQKSTFTYKETTVSLYVRKKELLLEALW